MAKSKKESDPQQWFLRTGVNAEFGPIEKSGLQLWAEQARILPGHEVSCDRVNWVAATSVEFLDMNWFIDDGDGDLKGPLNHLAAETLIQSGKFSDEARIVAADQIDPAMPEAEAATPKPVPVKSKPAKSKPVESKPVVKVEKERTVEATQDLHSDEDSDLNAERDVMRVKHDEAQKRVQELESRIKLLEKLLRQSKNEQKQIEERYVSSEDHQSIATDNSALKREVNGAKKRAEKLQEESRAKEVQLDRLKQKLSEQALQLGGSDKKVQDAIKARESALQQSRESERSFARLLGDANKRDVEYKSQIAALKKTSALSPAATDQFYSDQNAVFQILKREVESITKTMELEREYLEKLKTMGAGRQQELEKQRQILQNNIGKSPGEMTRRVLREQTTDPNAVRLRSELDNLRIAHERSCLQAEERERELNYKLKVMHSDCNKLMDQMLERERESISAQKQADKLVVAERELAELRRTNEAERKQFLANNNAMAAKIEEMESDFKGAAPEEVQSSEARCVKLASWMSLKK